MYNNKYQPFCWNQSPFPSIPWDSYESRSNAKVLACPNSKTGVKTTAGYPAGLMIFTCVHPVIPCVALKLRHQNQHLQKESDRLTVPDFLIIAISGYIAMLVSGRVEIEETQRDVAVSCLLKWCKCKLQWSRVCFVHPNPKLIVTRPFPVLPISSHLGIPGYPWPLKASRKVTLRLASSKKLRSESKVKTCSLEAHHW